MGFRSGKQRKKVMAELKPSAKRHKNIDGFEPVPFSKEEKERIVEEWMKMYDYEPSAEKRKEIYLYAQLLKSKKFSSMQEYLNFAREYNPYNAGG